MNRLPIEYFSYIISIPTPFKLCTYIPKKLSHMLSQSYYRNKNLMNVLTLLKMDYTFN